MKLGATQSNPRPSPIQRFRKHILSTLMVVVVACVLLSIPLTRALPESPTTEPPLTIHPQVINTANGHWTFLTVGLPPDEIERITLHLEEQEVDLVPVDTTTSQSIVWNACFSPDSSGRSGALLVHIRSAPSPRRFDLVTRHWRRRAHSFARGCVGVQLERGAIAYPPGAGSVSIDSLSVPNPGLGRLLRYVGIRTVSKYFPQQKEGEASVPRFPRTESSSRCYGLYFDFWLTESAVSEMFEAAPGVEDAWVEAIFRPF